LNQYLNFEVKKLKDEIDLGKIAWADKQKLAKQKKRLEKQELLVFVQDIKNGIKNFDEQCKVLRNNIIKSTNNEENELHNRIKHVTQESHNLVRN